LETSFFCCELKKSVIFRERRKRFMFDKYKIIDLTGEWWEEAFKENVEKIDTEVEQLIRLYHLSEKKTVNFDGKDIEFAVVNNRDINYKFGRGLQKIGESEIRIFIAVDDCVELAKEILREWKVKFSGDIETATCSCIVAHEIEEFTLGGTEKKAREKNRQVAKSFFGEIGGKFIDEFRERADAIRLTM
jgi:hypothetical protein